MKDYQGIASRWGFKGCMVITEEITEIGTFFQTVMVIGG
jgi:hypothetical protein